MAQASRALVRAGVFADVVDVGGGFPSVYPGMVPPDLATTSTPSTAASPR